MRLSSEAKSRPKSELASIPPPGPYKTLPDVIRAVARAQRVNQALSHIVDSMIDVVGASSAAAYVLGMDGHTLAVVVRRPEEAGATTPERPSLDVDDPALPSRAVQRRQVVFEDDHVAIPLLGDRRVLGVVTAQLPYCLRGEDMGEIASLAELLGATLELLLLRSRRAKRLAPQAVDEAAARSSDK